MDANRLRWFDAALARLVTGLASGALIVACGASGPAEPPTASPAGTSAAPFVPTSTPISVSTPSLASPTTLPSTPVVRATLDLAYQSTDPFLIPDLLDVYAPIQAGPWPVVVMFHGSPAGGMTKTDYAQLASWVADLGFVVFVPTWGRPASGGAESLLTREGLLAADAQASCAVAFAAAHGSEYGGDPATVVVFGHSAGAHAALSVAIGRPAPTTGCLGGQVVPTISALVTYEGDWLTYVDPGCDTLFAADPTILDTWGTWAVLPKNTTLKVVMLLSEDPGMPDLPVASLAVRDRTGALREQLTTNGALADGQISWTESQQLLFSMLKAQGNPTTLDIMPDSNHMFAEGAGWPVFLAAFEKAAAKP